MSSHSNPKVAVKQGTVVGSQGVLPGGGDFYSFKGIPYAVPPLGNLRFEAPVPLEKFSENELDCTKERDISFQKEVFSNDLVGSEDCLFLNVYTPKLKSDKPLPVMVYIHGGAYLFGSGNSDMYNPLYLLEEDVVVVTLNYRLGMLGFLSYPEGGLVGNMGLKDQALALKWVQENIHLFNGDANNVTAFGESAGSACVNLHMYSDNSKMLFHKAILQSGTSNMQWVMQMFPSYKAANLATNMGFKDTDPKKVVEYLKDPKTPPEAMLPYMLKGMTEDERRRELPIPYGPIIEPASPNAVVTNDPTQDMFINNKLDIPVMMGYNSNEGIIMVANAIKRLDDYENDLPRLIPRAVNIDIDGEEGKVICQQIREFYFKGEKVHKKTLGGLSDALSDYHFTLGAHSAAEIHAKHQHKSPLYFFRFDYDGDLGFYKKLFNFQHLRGVCHADELFYIFQTHFQDLPHKEDSQDTKIVRQMCRMWTNFAKYSNPTPSSNDALLDFKWNPVKQINGKNDEFVLDYLNISKESKMERQPDKERIHFWKDIFKMWNKDFVKPKL
ncbi:CES5A.2 family protein [Megaselia abdita]